MKTRNGPHRRLSLPGSSANPCADRSACSRQKANCTHGAPRVHAVLCAFLLLFAAVPPIRAQQNTPPIISAIPAQVTEEDTPLIGIPFTVWDVETPHEQLTFSTMLELPDGSISRDSMVVSGSGTNRQLSIFPPPDSSGTAVAFLTVRDSSGLSAAVKFNVLLRPVNDA